MSIAKPVTLLLLTLATSQAAASEAGARNYPSKPITIIVAYKAGGTNDIIARQVATKMSMNLGVSVIVENRPGAAGNIGVRYVAQAAPDGYVIAAVPVGNLSINQWVFADPGYDPEQDFAPITLAGTVPNVIVVNPSLPAAGIKELIAYAKKHPTAINFASMSSGSTGHLCGELFKLRSGIDMVHVPYPGAAPALTDLMGGHVQMMCDNVTNASSYIKAGKLKALGVTTLERVKGLEQVPTLDEQGMDGFEATSWFGFVAPAKTPKAILKTLNAEIVKALHDPDVKQQLEQQGLNVVGNTQDEFAQFITAETKKWRQVVQQAGVKLD